ncbi:MAG: symmetrical bis(5'-nucleosyl)-tetraphosphatase [Desulfobulbaceae bacterium]|nr:symmetrical bis(5'-nucleosyl)-tetraphosphatase [Desulfobulbaceae bacterium]
MAIYAVGDIQGYLQPLLQLLEKVNFNPKNDQLWLTGDLVNRGPESLESLRFVRNLGKSAKTVLGNHDLHLLAIAAGVRKEKRNDTLKSIFTAPDYEELINWLRLQPLVHIDPSINTLMIHAGVFPLWDEKMLLNYSGEFEKALRSDQYIKLLKNLNKSQQTKWKKSLSLRDQISFTFNSCTRMRFCTPELRLDLDFKGELGPQSQAQSLVPWFQHPSRHKIKQRIIFGHWSALGFHNDTNTICLDSGCIWGRKLTLIRLDKDEQILQIPCEQPS